MGWTYDEARARLADCGQAHLLEEWDRLTPAEQTAFLAQLQGLDFDLLQTMARRLTPDRKAAGPAVAPDPASPATVTSAERAALLHAGRQALKAGRVGVILVAGGQGSRLGFNGPKGAFPLGALSGASLFEIHARKLVALERQFGADLPFYIMTSPANDAATRAFFRDHAFFGLSEQRVCFFSQGMLPALFPDGRLVLEAPGRLFMSPDGHGGILQALHRSGMLRDMRRRGLDTLFYFQVDNPLVEIADPLLIGLHRERQAQFSLKVCAKRDPAEGLGVLARHGESGLMILEYSELTPVQQEARTAGGALLYKYGSVAIHAFSLDFLFQIASTGLPFHVAHKKVPFFDGVRTVAPETPNAYKFEKFIFDALPMAAQSVALEFDRENEFSPVKNGQGADSPDTAQRDMSRKFARWLEAAGIPVPRDASGNPAVPIEIDPRYAVGPDELKRRLPAGFAVRNPVWLR